MTGKKIYDLAYYGDAKGIDSIVKNAKQQRKFEIVSETNQYGANALHCLVRSKKSSTVKKETYWALMRVLPNCEKIKMLTTTDHSGYSPLDKAAFEGDGIVLELMLKVMKNLSNEFPKAQKYRTLLHSAAAGGHVTTLSVILEAWASRFKHQPIDAFLDKPDIDGNTALHLAALHRHRRAVDFLIEKGSCLSALNNGGETSLSYCLKLGTSKDSVLKRLDRSIEFVTRRQPHRVKATSLKIDFGPIVSYDKLHESYVISEVQNLAKKYDKEILFHPMCQTFVELKLQRLRGYCILNLLFYLAFLGSFTSFCFNRNPIFSTLTTIFIIPCFLSSFFLLIFNSLSHFLFLAKPKIRECIDVEKNLIDRIPSGLTKKKHAHKYGTGPLSCVYKISLLAWVLKIIWGPSTKSEKGLVLFGAWFICVSKLKVFSIPGRYIMVFQKVSRSFLRLFCVFSPFLFGFILALSLLQKQSLGFIANTVISLAMISGEYGYSDEYKLLEDMMSQLLFLMVIFLLGMVLMAVLVGLSVRDTSILLKDAKYLLTKQNIQLIFIAEDFGKWLSSFGISFVAQQLRIFDDLEVPSIDLSLKPSTRKDLIFNPDKTSKIGLKPYIHYCLFKIFGITFRNSSLYRKFPIFEDLQDELETFMISKVSRLETCESLSSVEPLG
ncbi:transient receptor potential channel pyrexia-like [Artemia franciscana]|uniref:Uncharacterized protein n=1 Tax=Artemia franciscana TaxID=6661 RepID=A0AA88LAX8_ARTSF|nr:hypothetical protein QYM36_009003 [Artemia franciscana]